MRGLWLAGCAAALSLTASAAGTKVSFQSGTQKNYEGKTKAAVGAAGGGNDFVVTCTKTAACETAWCVTSERVSVPAGTGGYALDFEIYADADWTSTGVSDSWGSSVQWFDATGRRLAKVSVDPGFRKKSFVAFRYCGEVPEGAVSAAVAFGVDGPNLPPGEKVVVRKTVLTAIPKGQPLPPQVVYDITPPLVYSRFTAPDPNPNLVAKYEIVDASEIDWKTAVVSNTATKASVPFDRTGNVLTLKPVRPWAKGINTLEIRVRDAVGNATVSRKAFLVGERPKTPVMSLRDDGVALVGGRPFFPIGIYGVSPQAFNGWDLDRAVGDLKRAGMNLLHSYSHGKRDEFMSAVARHGLLSWTYAFWAHHGDKWLVEKSRTDRSVFAWYTGDDTSVHVKPSELLDRDEAVHMLDGTRLSCQADVTGGDQVRSRYQPYVNFSDVFMPELYHVYAADPASNTRCVAYVIRDMEKAKDDIAKCGDGRPKALWPILQFFDGNLWKGYPAAEMLYGMSFAALIHGGNGITWFHYAGERDEARGRRYSGIFRTQADWAAFTNLTVRIAALSPVLLERTPEQPAVPVVVRGDKADELGRPAVSALVKRYAGATYVLAVNASSRPVKARLFASAPDGEGEVAWEERRVRLERGAFEDEFAGYGVHVYRFPEAVAETRVLGYHLDISNCKVPRLETMYRIADILQKLGYNHLQMNTEHTFAYPQHEAVWHSSSPMTPDDVRALDAHCAARGIELVPNQNSFGHLGKWLRLPEYSHLAESPRGGCHSAYRAEPMKFPMSLCPTDPRSIEFVGGLYDALLPCFRSKQVNVGLDETYELDDVTGCGRSAAEIKARGAERVYLDYFRKIHALVKARGHRMMFWGDIILHKPELIPEIPEDVTCLNWGYGRNHPFDREAAQFAAAKRRFLICPGTRTWGTISGCVPEMCQNVDRAVEAGTRHGAAGYLMADWDDGGGVSPWIVSLPPVVYLSLRVRGIVPTREQFAAEIDRVAGCRCGEALLAYGEIYRASRGRNDNATEMCYALREGEHYRRAVAKGVTDETLAAAKAQHEKAKALFDPTTAPQWIRDEFELLDLVCRASEVRAQKPDTANFRAMFESEYRRLWLTNSRPGGLEESLNINFGL